MRSFDKIPHQPERMIGRWGLGLNHRLGRVASIRMDQQGVPIYEGVTLDGDPWWTRSFSALDDRDHSALEALYETRRGSRS